MGESDKTSELDKRKLELSARQLLINFYGSEISTHGRVFIGFAALIFAIVSIRLTLKTGEIALYSWQLGIIYLSIFFSGLAIFYVLFRLVGYGYFANAVIHAQTSADLLETDRSKRCFIAPLVRDIKKHAFKTEKGESKILGLFPVRYFMSANEQWKGVVLSIGFSIGTTSLFFLLLDLEILFTLFP